MTTTQQQILNRLKNKVSETFVTELTSHSVSKLNRTQFSGTPGIGRSAATINFNDHVLALSATVASERSVVLESTFDQQEAIVRAVEVNLSPAFLEDNVEAIDDAVSTLRYAVQDALNDFEDTSI